MARKEKPALVKVLLFTAALISAALYSGPSAAQSRPTLTNPLIISLKTSGNSNHINAGGRDVLLRWPAGAVTDPQIRIDGARSVISERGAFTPRGTASRQGAIEFTNATGTVYLANMLIDLTARRMPISDPKIISKIPITGDAIGFGGRRDNDTPLSFPHFTMRRSIVRGVSGQHPDGCAACGGAHADGFQMRGPVGDIRFIESTIESTYQAFLAAPSSSIGLAANAQQRGAWYFTRVVGRTVKPAGLTTEQSRQWMARAKTWFIDNSYNGMGKFDLRFSETWNDPGGGDPTCRAHIYGQGDIRCGKPSRDYVSRSEVGP